MWPVVDMMNLWKLTTELLMRNTAAEQRIQYVTRLWNESTAVIGGRMVGCWEVLY